MKWLSAKALTAFRPPLMTASNGLSSSMNSGPSPKVPCLPIYEGFVSDINHLSFWNLILEHPPSSSIIHRASAIRFPLFPLPFLLAPSCVCTFVRVPMPEFPSPRLNMKHLKVARWNSIYPFPSRDTFRIVCDVSVGFISSADRMDRVDEKTDANFMDSEYQYFE
ncbi:hypothetical protein CEXT_707251 [Caerostris extrusa]|uniref:Uncharacterized protein n=1 Tax=Caerostris extrusa TaxID=172846 RepID=A0AAV4R1K4_CAEEX|nr:hypothetical protein CEXT_707251 [Caerostris extrusa]